MTACPCGKPSEPGRDECFLCRVRGVGFAFRGGALQGHSGWHMTKNEYLKEHLRVDSEKELAKRPNVERAER